MQAFTVKLRVCNCEHLEKFDEFEVVVDRAEVFSRLRRSRLNRLDVVVSRKMSLRIIEGRVIERDIATVQLAAEERMAFENVVIVEDEEVELLGSHAIEGFGLAVDQIQEKLVPAVMWALAIGGSQEPWLGAKS
jgi:hypothetical protein